MYNKANIYSFSKETPTLHTLLIINKKLTIPKTDKKFDSILCSLWSVHVCSKKISHRRTYKTTNTIIGTAAVLYLKAKMSLEVFNEEMVSIF